MKREDFFVYVYGTSMIYKINPLLKFIGMIVFSCMVMIDNELVTWSCFIVLGFLILCSKIRINHIVKGSLFVLVFVALCKLLAVLSISFSPLNIKFADNALMESFMYILRIMMIFFANALFYTTTTLSSFRRTLHIYEKRICPGVPPVYLPSTMLMLFLKFIPLCISSWHELETAWVIRNGKKGLRQIYILLPKFIERMLKKALDTAYAMNMRLLQ